VSISRIYVSSRRRGRRWRRGRRRRRRTSGSSRLDDPLVLIMTPFFIILDRLTDPCESFLDHPVHCRFLPAPCLGRKPRLDLTFSEDEMDFLPFIKMKGRKKNSEKVLDDTPFES
jgi:hypothetical protein